MSKIRSALADFFENIGEGFYMRCLDIANRIDPPMGWEEASANGWFDGESGGDN